MTSRRPQPVAPVTGHDYERLALRELAAFIASYHLQPAPQDVRQVFECFLRLGLPDRQEHRFGVAGAVEGFCKLHPEMLPAWKHLFPTLIQLATALRPGDGDHEIVRAAAIDYLWMVGLVMHEDEPIERIFRLAHRRDPVGDAAVLVLGRYAGHEIVARIAQRLATTTPPPRHDDGVPAETIRQLATAAALDPVGSAAVLFVGWKPPAAGATGYILVVTVDGVLPRCLPSEADGHAVKVRRATELELVEAKRRHLAMEQP